MGTIAYEANYHTEGEVQSLEFPQYMLVRRNRFWYGWTDIECATFITILIHSWCSSYSLDHPFYLSLEEGVHPDLCLALSSYCSEIIAIQNSEYIFCNPRHIKIHVLDRIQLDTLVPKELQESKCLLNSIPTETDIYDRSIACATRTHLCLNPRS